MNKRYIYILFIGILYISNIQLLVAQPEAKDLHKYFQKTYKEWNIPGFAIGIIKDGEVVLSEGYGVLEDQKKTAVDGNSLFAIASNTKAFISASIGILVDEGKLNWDDPVRKYLPYFELYDDYVSNHTTVRDLLCHRVGLGTYSGDVLWYKSDYTAEEVIKRAAEVPKAYEFRAGYGYTNLMFITAGEVIKVVSGQNWDEFIKERILAPLEMNRTQTTVTVLDKMENVATPHKPVGEANQAIPYAKWDNMGAAGGIISSTNDMLKWIQLQIEGGTWNETQIISGTAQAEYWTLHNSRKVSANAKDLYPGHHFRGYGLGWAIMDYGGRFVANHGGGYDGMYSKVAIVPEENLGIVILTNSMKGISNPMMYYILDAYMGFEEKDWSKIGLRWQEASDQRWASRIPERSMNRGNSSPDLTLENYVGSFICPMYGDIEVKYEGGQLSLHFAAAPSLDATLKHWEHNTFDIVWNETHAWFDFGTLQFILDNRGEVQSLQFDVPNNDIFFEEIKAVRK